MNENALQVFTYDGHEVRTVERDRELWWVLRDVCNVLSISHVTDTARRLEEDEVGQTDLTDALGRPQNTIIINEAGLYNVILRSDKPNARDFKRWVTHEVLPSIRKTGFYSVEPRKPMTQLEQIAATMESVAALAKAAVNSERRMNDLERAQQEQAEKLHGIAATFAAPPTSEETWQEYANSTINEIVESHGLNHQTYRRDLYDILERRARCDLNMRQKRMKKRMADAGKGVNEQKLATKLHIIAIDPKLRAIFDGVLREEQAKYLCNT